MVYEANRNGTMCKIENGNAPCLCILKYNHRVYAPFIQFEIPS
jgi:hypothetical protein